MASARDEISCDGPVAIWVAVSPHISGPRSLPVQATMQRAIEKSEMERTRPLQMRARSQKPLNHRAEKTASIWRHPMFASIGEHLDQDRSAIDHDCLSSAESFLHQKQIGLRDVMSFANSPLRQTLAHAFEK